MTDHPSPFAALDIESAATLKPGDLLEDDYGQRFTFASLLDQDTLSIQRCGGDPSRFIVSPAASLMYVGRPAAPPVDPVRSWTCPGPNWYQSRDHTFDTLPEWSLRPDAPAPRSAAERIAELLEANNRYQQEALDARAEVREFEVEYDRLLDAAKAVCLAAWTDRHSRLHGHATVEALDKVISPQAETEPAATEQKAPPPPPWPCGGENNANAKREGWLAFFTGRARGDCPFPPAMPALWDAFGIGWDAAQARQRGTGSRG